MRWSAPSRAGVACDRAARRVGLDGRDGATAPVGLDRETGRDPSRRSRSAAMPERHQLRVAVGIGLDRHGRQAAAARRRDGELGGRPHPRPDPRARESGSVVRDVGAPARVDERIASRLRVSGRRRTTTTWSAPVPIPSSSTIASTMASGDTDRARPRRIRAKDSASVRRVPSVPAASSALADRRRGRRGPASTTTTRSRGRGSTSSRSSLDRRRGPRTGGRRGAGSGRAVDAQTRVAHGARPRNLTLGRKDGAATAAAARAVAQYCRRPGPGTSVRGQAPRNRTAASRPAPPRLGGGRGVASARRRHARASGSTAGVRRAVRALHRPGCRRRPSRRTGRASATAIRSVAERPSCGWVAMPIEAPIGKGCRPSAANGDVAECLEDALGDPGRLLAVRSPGGSARTRRRRSGPRRPRRGASSGRGPPRGPAPGPRRRGRSVSLTSLKSSRSSITTLSGRAGAGGAHDLLRQSLVQVPVVEEAGQRVAVGQVAGGLVQARILERHRGLVGHRPGERDPAGVHGRPAARGQLHQPDRLALGDQRQHHQAAHPLRAQERHLGRDPRPGPPRRRPRSRRLSRTWRVSG